MLLTQTFCSWEFKGTITDTHTSVISVIRRKDIRHCSACLQASVDLLSVTVDQNFLWMQSQITQHVLLCLPSFIKHNDLRFIHAVACTSNYKWAIHNCMDVSHFFIHLSVDRHLGCSSSYSPDLAVRSKACVNFHMRVFVRTCVVFSWMHAQGWDAYVEWQIVPHFFRNSQTVQSGCTILHFHEHEWWVYGSF